MNSSNMPSGMARIKVSMKVGNGLTHFTIYKIGRERKVLIKTGSTKSDDAHKSEYALNNETGDLDFIAGAQLPEEVLPKLAIIVNQYFGRSWSRTIKQNGRT